MRWHAQQNAIWIQGAVRYKHALTLRVPLCVALSWPEPQTWCAIHQLQCSTRTAAAVVGRSRLRRRGLCVLTHILLRGLPPAAACFAPQVGPNSWDTKMS